MDAGAQMTKHANITIEHNGPSDGRQVAMLSTESIESTEKEIIAHARRFLSGHWKRCEKWMITEGGILGLKGEIIGGIKTEVKNPHFSQNGKVVWLLERIGD